MSTFQPYKGTGTPPVTVQDGNIYFDLVNKSILVDHNDARYTFSGTDTVSTTMTGASSSTAGTAGMVPAPQAGYEERYLQGDGTWDIPAARHGIGLKAVTEGNNTLAREQYSHAEGNGTIADGDSSHVEGYNTYALGTYSHAEGNSTTALGVYSHAEGWRTITEGDASHAEGNSTYAYGSNSHAEGYTTTAYGAYSHSEGYNTVANTFSQHVFGAYNIIDDALTGSSTSGHYIEIAGNGTSNLNRANARTLDWKGNETISGNLNSKHPTIDSSSANNNVTATAYLSTFDIRDSADRSMSKLETLVDPSGNIGGYWWVRNFDTSGNVVGKKGIVMQMDKTGAITYYVSEPNKFRDAIGVSSGGGSGGSYLPLSGGIITGQLGLKKSPTDGTNRIYVSNEDGSVFTGLHVGSGGVNNGVYNFAPLNQWLIYCNATDVYAGAINVTTAAKALSSIGAAAANHSHTLASLGAAASSHNHDAGNITSGRLGHDRMPYWTNQIVWESGSHSTTYGASGYMTFTTSAGVSNALYAVVTCILDASNTSLGYVDLVFPRQYQGSGYAWFGSDDNYVGGRWYGIYNGAYYSRKFGRLALNESGGYGDLNLYSNGYKNTTGGNQYLCPVRIQVIY